MTTKRRTFTASEQLLRRAEAVIPLGSQTFSKSKTQLPFGVSPYFAARGQGPFLYDVDGNEYIDFTCSLGAITLGYNDADVNAAVIQQLNDGALFSLPCALETEVAERIVDRVPSAEMVRFGKNGSDATSGAVRLARAHTGREMIAACGYHGWQDWYIGTTTLNRGVPESTRALTKIFAYNNIDSLKALFTQHPGQFAAVIMEPTSFEAPRDDFLHKVRELCASAGTLLIFDEVVTGFRFAPGTAQAMLGVTPDLTCLGKGLANGLPLSAVAGPAHLMKLYEEVFFSFTMGGEALSLAAARACLDKASRLGTMEATKQVGEGLLRGVQERIHEYQLDGALRIAGHPTWTNLFFTDQPGATAFELKTLFMQECFQRGIYSIGIHFLSFAHKTEHVQRLLAAYDEVFPMLREAIKSGNVRGMLRCEPLRPLFKVR